jgi:hypothetical protein
MDRRVAGVAVLAAVIIACLLVPAIGGRRVSGTAERAHTPDPPRVGDCLGVFPSQPSAMGFGQAVFAAETQPCGQVNVGEVVAVVPHVYFSPPTLDNGTSVAQSLACDPFVSEYLGWSSLLGARQGAGESSAVVQWRSADSIATGLLGPDLAQYLASQRWIACVVYPKYGPFQGSIRGSVRDGHDADAFGSCYLETSDIAAAEGISCTEPHQTEIFGWANLSDQAAVLNSSCLALVRQVTGMNDPTAGGALEIATAISDNQMACSSTVVESRQLVGTLIGIGDQALPWQG